jgi:diguanylate cyclase (GGDEF)-like protein
MPEMDGYEVITALKKSVKTRNIPVIFITGLDAVEGEEKGLMFGAVDYISKPFNPVVVEIRVQNQVKILKQFREIEQLSMHDQLTGLPNRRCFEARIKTEWGRALREKTPISLLLIDIDKFKNYNDSYGHQQGDIALQVVSKVLGKTLRRPSDFAARWGGEEFIVLLPNTDSNGAFKMAEQLRINVESLEIPCSATDDRSAAKTTISIGANTRIQKYNTLDKFISDADMMLYKAKKNGRNQVMQENNSAK